MQTLEITSENINSSFLSSLKDFVLKFDPKAKIRVCEDEYSDEFLDSCLKANEEAKKDMKSGKVKLFDSMEEYRKYYGE